MICLNDLVKLLIIEIIDFLFNFVTNNVSMDGLLLED